MNDVYQATYDAVQSRITNTDVGAAVETVVREANLSHYAELIADNYRHAAAMQERPCVLYRPALSIDGNQWCALYGANLQDGIAGFGDSPELAMHDFDRNWSATLRSQS